MSNRLFVGTRKGLFTVQRGSRGWSVEAVAFLGDPVTSIAVDRQGTVHAALKHEQFGAMMRSSRDGGATWTEIATPKYPPKPDDLVDVLPESGRPIPWSVVQVWALAVGADPALLWCGTIPGGLFRSTDRGASWELVRSLWLHPKRREWFGGGAGELPGLHSICVDPTDDRRLTVGVSCGGAWRTTDGGESWEVRTSGMYAEYMPPERREDPYIQDPHCIVQSPASPAVFWCQHHNGIFRSIDDCATWQSIEDVRPSKFGFATAVHPAKPDTAWFVPAAKDELRIPVDGKVVVTRTRDGGKTFEVLREGLPQDHAYDLTYRHALDVDETGDRLAFGTTTGSLWVSENQGDSWQTAAAHLPPVYCVRFARSSLR